MANCNIFIVIFNSFFLGVEQINAILSWVCAVNSDEHKALELLMDILTVPLEEKAWKTVSYKTRHTYFYFRIEILSQELLRPLQTLVGGIIIPALSGWRECMHKLRVWPNSLHATLAIVGSSLTVLSHLLKESFFPAGSDTPPHHVHIQNLFLSQPKGLF